MIQKQDSRFSLCYDLATDLGELRFDRDLLVAKIIRGAWHVLNGPAWFEFEFQRSSRSSSLSMSRRRDTPRLQLELYRLRVLAGLGSDSILRAVALYELNKWDALMKHGVWKCKKKGCPRCERVLSKSLYAA